MDREKVIKGVHDARRYLEDREWVDKSAGVHIDALNDALALLKEQEEQKRQWLQNIADNQLAFAPTERDNAYCYIKHQGIHDGLQMAWDILTEDDNVHESEKDAR